MLIKSKMEKAVSKLLMVAMLMVAQLRSEAKIITQNPLFIKTGGLQSSTSGDIALLHPRYRGCQRKAPSFLESRVALPAVSSSHSSFGAGSASGRESAIRGTGAAPTNTIGTLHYAYERLKQQQQQNTDGPGSTTNVTVLGSTGSIGKQTLEIIEESEEVKFNVLGLAAGGENLELLASQVAKFRPHVVAVRDPNKVEDLARMIKTIMRGEHKLPQVLGGQEGVVEVARYKDPASSGQGDVVVSGIVGLAGLLPTISAIKAGKQIALANKETLISAGPVIVPLLHKSSGIMIPADSEHSAIFQCLQGSPPGSIRRLILTASGGAFRDWTVDQMQQAKLDDALKHPNWSMGAKITIDSATLMNKGLEVIEAHYLFGTSYDNIDVVIHPQSIIHSMVEFSDTSVVAQMGWPDMKLPLLYSLTWPARVEMKTWKPLNLVKIGALTFKAPDVGKFPCLRLGYEAGRASGTMPAVLNGANEAAVAMFRNRQLEFMDIPAAIEFAMNRHKTDHKTERITLDDIMQADSWARRLVKEEFTKKAAIMT